ncbi:c-type cytochrome [Novosphingobium naphthalenivorans]|uniref:c-type cytochrome n=1 Tax=Novosphingobium naphthalenivorans TaxID=273168 RepID=UPI00082E4CDD|nr:cytochrome c [Novosphingobium naphthalenivorans]
MHCARWFPLLLILTVAIGGWFMFDPVYSKGRHSQGEGHGNRHRQDAAITASPLSDTEAKQASVLFAKTCAACHGEKLEGGVGPSLVGVGSRYSLDKIERIAQYGKGRQKPVSMPSGLATADEATLLARWLATNPAQASSPTTQPKAD